jgi:hypothetical protein
MCQYVTVAPSSSNQKAAFKRLVENECVALGWLSDSNLTGKTLSEVYALIDEQIAEEVRLNDKKEQETVSAKRNQDKVKRYFSRFLAIQPGMIVVVPNVNYGLHGVGRVTSGYQFQKNKHDSTGDGSDNYSHYFSVEWLSIPSNMLTKEALMLPGEKIWPPRGTCSAIQEGAWLSRLLEKVEGSSPQQPPMVLLAEHEDEVIVEETTVEPKPYTGDKFHIDEKGHFIGDDGFMVPRSFDEFYTLYPDYVRRWVQKRIHHNTVTADVEDWEADLLMHLRYLPESSKFRKPGNHRWHPEGCEDVIQVFDPILQYGASARRFFNYMKNCLSNRYSTINSKRIKNPICTMGNYTLGSPVEEYSEVVDDEFVHHHAAQPFKPISQDVKIFLDEYRAFVAASDEELLVVLEAIANTGSYREAMDDLNMSEQEFTRCRNRLRVLKECFINGQSVPKQRKPYKKREGSPALTLVASIAVA